MSDYATKDDVKEIVNKAVDDLTQIIGNFAQQTDDRFNKVEAKTHSIKTTVDEIKSEIIDLRASHDRLVNTIDGFVKRLEDNEIENAARDAQFARLLDWAEKVAEKTGIPLPALK